MVKDKILQCFKNMPEKIENFTEKFKFLAEDLPNDVRKRTASALVLIPIVLFFIYFSASLFTILVLAATIIMTYEWSSLLQKAKKEEISFWKIIGLIYILIPCASLIIIRGLEKGDDIILWLFMVIWATDTAGYFIGCTIGGPKIAPSISPKKSWSGLAGGVVASMFIGLISSFMFKEGVIFFLSFSGVLAIIEQASDMLESKIKRHFGVKDTGTLIPGHGGLLDRVDGFILVAPIVLLFALFSSSIF